MADQYDDINDSWSRTSFFDGRFAGHLSTWNCLFADGHVKAMRPTKTMTPVNMWGRFSNQGTYGTNDGCFAAGWDAATADKIYDLNCDTSSPNVLNFLGALESQNQ